MDGNLKFVAISGPLKTGLLIKKKKKKKKKKKGWPEESFKSKF